MAQHKALNRLQITVLSSGASHSGEPDSISEPNSATPLRPQKDRLQDPASSTGPLSDGADLRNDKTSSKNDQQMSIPSSQEHTLPSNLGSDDASMNNLPSHASTTSSSRTSRPISFNSSIQTQGPKEVEVAFKALDNNLDNEAQRQIIDHPHHIFDRRKKRRLVWLISLAAMFSPLSSNIYFPALPEIAEDLKTPSTLIALTVSTYMIFQGLSPSLWGPLADTYGRRPILLSTLFVYVIANLILAFTINFPMLLVFRGIQAFGSASTIAIGAGVIGDIAVASERGGLMGLFGGIRMFGQAVGPVFGGALAHTLGFRSIFWFLFGLGILVTLLLGLVLPETLRKIAGNGSKPLYGIYKPWMYAKEKSIPKQERPQLENLSFGIFLDLLRPLGEKDVFVALLFGSIIYTVWSMITASTSTLFKHEYKLSQVLIGLCFLPNGIGCVVGSHVSGRIMDRDYKREASLFREMNKLPIDTEIKQEAFPDFPLEHARLRSVYVLTILFALATAIYGFSLEWHIAFPLILQFITAFTATSIYIINSTLMIDLYPTKPASATAINNLARCAIGSLGVSLVEKSIHNIREALTFIILASIALISISLVIIQHQWAPEWRKARLLRQKYALRSEHDGNIQLQTRT